MRAKHHCTDGGQMARSVTARAEVTTEVYGGDTDSAVHALFPVAFTHVLIQL